MVLKAGAAALIFFFLCHGGAQSEECGREALAAIVNQASTELIAMNDANKKQLQEKLQQLRAKSGWSEAEFVTQATPFIKDDRIAGYDAEHNALLAKVPEIGAVGSVASLASSAPAVSIGAGRSCALVTELRQLMSAVVENSRAKWTYVFGKLDAALESSGDRAKTQ
jgi:hypothetical protein